MEIGDLSEMTDEQIAALMGFDEEEDVKTKKKKRGYNHILNFASHRFILLMLYIGEIIF